MDPLHTAVNDLSWLIVTRRALHALPADGSARLPRGLRAPLRAELKRATLAYVRTLARARAPCMDTALLTTCRMAAEAEMSRALPHQAALANLLSGQSGVMHGLTALRQDLWRLAHLIAALHAGVAAYRARAPGSQGRLAQDLGDRLQRRLRKGLTAYARAMLQGHGDPLPIVAARRRALAKIGPAGASAAERLADLSSEDTTNPSSLQRQVGRPWLDLSQDWHIPSPATL